MKKLLKDIIHFDSNSNVFSFNIALFHCIGISIWHHGCRQKLVKALALSFLLMFWAFRLTDMFNHIYPFVLDKFMQSLSLSVAHFIGLYKFLLLLKDKKKFFEIMEFINSRQFKPDDEDSFVMRKKRLFVNIKVISGLVTFAYATTLFYFLSLTPLTESQVAMKFPDDKMYLFWLMYVQTCISSLISTGVSIGSSFILLSILNYLSLEFKILANSFGKLLDTIDEDMSDSEMLEIVKEMKSYIKYYQRLLHITSKLRRILLYPLLFLVLCLVVIISLCMFEAASSEEYLSSTFSARLNLVLAISTEIFMFSFRGEILKEESQMISDKTYNSNWYQLRLAKQSCTNLKVFKEFRTMVQLTILRANRPIRISAGGFTNMRYQTSLRVMKFCYSIVTILIQTKNRTPQK